MAAKNVKIFDNNSSGASIIEVVLAMAIVGLATPFVYNQISRTNREIRAMSIANKIVSVRDGILNFIRINQDDWPQTAQIELLPDELEHLSPYASAGFIDKYDVSGASVTDVYLAFDIANTEFESKQIADKIGGDAAVVAYDNVAYASTWAAAAPVFKPGQIIYRVTRDLQGEDRTKYLHRGSSGEEKLNQMQRDLNMGGNALNDVGTVNAESVKISNTTATFVSADDVYADAIYFSSGANLNGTDAIFDSLRVSGDTSGFRNITTNILNNTSHSTSGRIIADRATVNNKIDVANDFVLKSSSLRTVSGFTVINANSAFVPYVSTDTLVFYNDYGLTVTGELLLSNTAPLKIGNWSFPSNTPPKFNVLNLSRASIPSTPQKSDFSAMYDGAWQTITPPEQMIQ